MSRWSPDRSSLLSLLLDEVTGTQKAIEIRQDYAIMLECLQSDSLRNYYYTGSKAEGLDLPGSDDDFMYDINNEYNVKVIQSTDKTSDMSSNMILYLRTENVKPGFALLEIHRMPTQFQKYTEIINGVQYLSSDLIAQCCFDSIQVLKFSNLFKRQGPSLENNFISIFTQVADQIEGTDQVLCIHCDFWPNEASEWRLRPRNFGWPTPLTLSSIVSFGFHLVAIGHPHSETKLTEWRISFSVAERTLACTFNHVQMQCYAVMKIILKQFIKKKCSPKNQVLCSYFVKTFLFWQFETTDTQFWREDNFRECISYLITEFAHCLHDGVLPHYFIPSFNLLSVKLTREAQRELLQLYEIIIQYDISILKECKSFQPVWSKFLSADENHNSIRRNALKAYFIQNDELILRYCNYLVYSSFNPYDFENAMKHLMDEELVSQFVEMYNLLIKGKRTIRGYDITSIMSLPCKSHLKPLVVKQILWDKYLQSLTKLYLNKKLYKLHQIAYNESSTFDPIVSKIWYAIMLMSRRDFSSALSIVNNVLSSIPPFYLCISSHDTYNRNEAKQLYVDRYINSGLTVSERAREAWLLPLVFQKYMFDTVPLAIQIELYFCCSTLYNNFSVTVSPIVMLHYLAFQCYHALGQYNHRDNALYQLLDDVNTDGLIHDLSFCSSFNIAGHCLVIAGDKDRARSMFTLSKHLEKEMPSSFSLKGTAATWYLHHFC